MANLIRTWWGQRFIAAMEQFTDSNRLARGRAYAGNGRIEKWQLEKQAVVARVRGNINPYFGVTRTPYYQTRVNLEPIPAKAWQVLIQHIGHRAAFVSQLLLNEMPDNIEEPFLELDLHLLPYSVRDMHTDCSCPDYFNPCKHLAGLCYCLAAHLDHDPFLLFELRGITREALFEQLKTTPLGKALARAQTQAATLPPPATTYYTRPVPVASPTEADPLAFWRGTKPLPSALPATPDRIIAAACIRRGGDYPAFWPGSEPLGNVMEGLYGAIRKKSGQW